MKKKILFEKNNNNLLHYYVCVGTRHVYRLSEWTREGTIGNDCYFLRERLDVNSPVEGRHEGMGNLTTDAVG